MELSEARKHIGRRVIYTPFEGCPYEFKEVGVITAVTDKFVFVRYGSKVNSEATCCYDLKLELEV